MVPEAKSVLSRRQFFRFAASAALVAGSGILLPFNTANAYSYRPGHNLPYPIDGLEPIISAKTVSYHFWKHTYGYYRKTARYIAGTRYADMSLPQMIVATADRPDRKAIYNNAAQAWNHTFYWNGLTSLGGGRPGGKLLQALEDSFGSFGRFREDFIYQAGKVFGSGWVWLVDTGKGFKILGTQNADTPLTMGYVPLLTVDV